MNKCLFPLDRAVMTDEKKYFTQEYIWEPLICRRLGNWKNSYTTIRQCEWQIMNSLLLVLTVLQILHRITLKSSLPWWLFMCLWREQVTYLYSSVSWELESSIQEQKVSIHKKELYNKDKGNSEKLAVFLEKILRNINLMSLVLLYTIDYHNLRNRLF